ncbi:MAG: NAD-dependent epimerase/dehydratase family protein [Planctomycetota bacterium]|nr:NAD-dependent epimerase/dehydratase family protein [Planctomycetota bacterium]
MKALVTGGGGFLGGAIVRRLRARGDAVRSFSRGTYPDLEKLGVAQFRGDLGADRDALFKAAEGCDAVFHVAAKAGVSGSAEAYRRANVLGTEHVLAACRAHRIAKLVFTSSPSVTFDGADQEGVDERAPYPAMDRFLADYPRTKALAEQMVLGANGAELATVALRPHLIWGPGDTNLVPRILTRAKAGKLRLIETHGKKVDATYIDNAALAHLLAAERLAPGAPCAGKAYFVSNGEPAPMDEIVNGILAAAGLPPVTKKISPGMAYLAGALLEGWHGLFKRGEEPPLTRFVARQLATAHWFDLTAAKRDLNYAPEISTKEGLRRLAEHLRATA